MSINRLVAEARRARRNAKHNLQMIRRNPEIMMPGRLEGAIEYLETISGFAKEEMKNARRAGRTHLRNRLRNLLFSIAQNERSVKQKLEVK